jgi:uncharacterized protein
MELVKNFILLFIVNSALAQNKNFIDMPYLETSAKVDTMLTPDRIYISILIAEKDTKGKISVEEQEKKMMEKLKGLGIDITKQLSLKDLSSNFNKSFLRQQEIQKSKLYALLVYDAKTAGKVLLELENESISNVYVEKTAYSKIEELRLELRTKAVIKAKQFAVAMLKPLNQKVGNAIFIADNNNESEARRRSPATKSRVSSSFDKSDSDDYTSNYEFEKIKVEEEVEVKFKIE